MKFWAILLIALVVVHCVFASGKQYSECSKKGGRHQISDLCKSGSTNCNNNYCKEKCRVENPKPKCGDGKSGTEDKNTCYCN
uniref:FS-H/FSI antigen family member 4 n=1 Tax=Ctenocephalides felis TaxID=7515 RepID=I3VPF3_CTEFE